MVTVGERIGQTIAGDGANGFVRGVVNDPLQELAYLVPRLATQREGDITHVLVYDVVLSKQPQRFGKRVP